MRLIEWNRNSGISIAVGTGTWGIAAVIPKYLSLRLPAEPIVTPYFRIGKRMKLELPIGNLLKTAIWGDRDNPLRFQPRPMPTP